MRLEIGSIHVRDVEMGAGTALRDHTLVIDPEELRTLILEDPHFTDVRVRVVKPGSATPSRRTGRRTIRSSWSSAGATVAS